MNINRTRLEKMLHNRTSQEEAFAYYDQLESVELAMMQGLWKGKELHTGHPMEGLLGICRWYGKKFDDKENIYPLVFETDKHKLYYANPRMMSLNVPFEKIPKSIISGLFKIVYPFIGTKKSKARLRMIEYRGKVSASMVYDQLPIIDIFRKVDDNTVIGIMDMKHSSTNKSYFFILNKK